MPATRNRHLFRIHQAGEIMASVNDVEAIEAAAKDLAPGRYEIDWLAANGVNGYTSGRWGSVTRQADGSVEIEKEGGISE